MNQSEQEANRCRQRQARENACGQVTIGLGLASHWLKIGASITTDVNSAMNQSEQEENACRQSGKKRAGKS